MDMCSQAVRMPALPGPQAIDSSSEGIGLAAGDNDLLMVQRLLGFDSKPKWERPRCALCLVVAVLYVGSLIQLWRTSAI